LGLGLSERQKRFVAAWQGQGSGVDAARAAGYKGDSKTLKVRASKLLTDPAVKRALASRAATATTDSPAIPESSGGPVLEPDELLEDAVSMLDPDVRRFVARYRALGSWMAAAREVWAESARQEVAKLRARPEVVRAVEAAGVARRAELIATREEREAFLTKVMRGEVTETKFDAEGAAHEVALVFARLRAAELLGKMQDILKPEPAEGATDAEPQIIVFVGNGRGPEPTTPARVIDG
jgi:hypothetical protein